MSHPGIVYLDENNARRHVRHRCCPGFNGLGILGSLFSILGVFTFGLASPVGLGLSLLALRRGPRFAATLGTILGGVGTAFLALWGWAAVAAMNAVEYEDQAQRTALVLQEGADAVEDFRVDNKYLPDGIDGNKLLIAKDLQDAWGTSIRYDALDDHNYLIRSAGPDKEFDTADDLTRR